MSDDPSPYEIATLAAQINPDLCRDRATHGQAVSLALDLIQAAFDHVMERKKHNRKTAGLLASAAAFAAEHDLKPDKIIEFKKAARIITDHVADRRTSLAVKKFRVIVAQHEDAIPPEYGGGYNVAALLKEYVKSGVRAMDVINWRLVAEKYGYAKKYCLTDGLRPTAENPRKTSEPTARAKIKKRAIRTKKRANS